MKIFIQILPFEIKCFHIYNVAVPLKMKFFKARQSSGFLSRKRVQEIHKFYMFPHSKICGVNITQPVLIEDHTMHFTPVLNLRCYFNTQCCYSNTFGCYFNTPWCYVQTLRCNFNT